MSLARKPSGARNRTLRSALAVAIAVLSLVIALRPASEVAYAAVPPQLDWTTLVDIKGATWPWGSPVIAVDGDDTWVTWVDGRNASDVAVRHKSGSSWGNPFTVHSAQASSQSSPWIAADNGVAHVVWVDERDGDKDIYYRHSQVRGWSPELELSDDTATNEPQLYPVIAVEGDEVHAVWADAKTGRYEIYYRHFDGTQWGDEVVLSDESLPQNKLMPSIAVEGGVIHVAWACVSSDVTLMYRRFSGGEWGTIETIYDSAGKDGLDPKLRVDGGVPYVLYTTYDGATERIYIRHKGLARWSLPEEVGWAGVPGSQATPSFDVEAGHIYLLYLNKNGLDWFVYFRHYDGTTWGDAVRMHTNSPILYDKGPYIEASGGVVHAAFYYLRDEFYTAFYYTTATLDTALPTSLAPTISSYWMDQSGEQLGWSASDDYGLGALNVYYRSSRDRTLWSDLTLYTAIKLDPVKGQSGVLTVTPPRGEYFYQWETRAVDLGGRVEVPLRPLHVSSAFDDTPPTGTMAINGGGAWTTSDDLTLNVTFHDTMTTLNWTGIGPVPFKVRYSDNDESFGAETWEDYSGPRAWTGSEGEGNKTIYFQVMDAAGLVSGTLNGSIGVDMTPPLGVIDIEGGSAVTGKANVTLHLNYTDAASGVDAVRYSNDGVWDNETWETPAHQVNWTLTTGDGLKTVRYQVRDAAGLLSANHTDAITLDTVPPAVAQTTPAGNATKFDPKGSIVIQFSEPMDRPSVEAAFNLSDAAGAPVGGTFSWSPDGRTLTFMPNEPLDKGKSYRVTVGPGAKDLAGNPPGAVDYTFKTAPKAEDGGLGGVVGLMAAAALAAVAAMARPRRGGPPRHRKG
jgi:hypothetical protein